MGGRVLFRQDGQQKVFSWVRVTQVMCYLVLYIQAILSCFTMTFFASRPEDRP